MGQVSTVLRYAATESGGGSIPHPEENFRTPFSAVARALWPHKTDQHLAVIAGTSDRAARDWLRGKVAPPAIIIAAVVVAITKN